MNSTSSHIVSSFRWNTSIDRKEYATDLQNRISSWSNTHMPREIDEVLSHICPSEQTWRIQSLELDLGTIDLEHLEGDLSLQLQKLLYEQLMRMVVHGDLGGRNFEVIHKSISQEEMLIQFFLYGTMPWSYTSSENSVNQLLEDQLKHNKERISEQLKKAGKTHERVRRRMAWQMTEPNFRRFVQAIEPHNHVQIELLSEQFITLQKKEMIVQSSITDFKRHVWFWVLNHLLTERGTLFNKTSFIKSSVRQMANQYQVTYSELLLLIERTIEEVSTRVHIDMEFMTILRSIVRENKSGNPEQTGAINSFDAATELRALLDKSPANLSADMHAELNDLILHIAESDPQQFNALIISLFKEHDFSGFIELLNTKTLRVILDTIQPLSVVTVSDTIEFIKQVSRNQTIENVELFLWKKSVQHVLENTSESSTDPVKFMDFCLTVLSEKTSVKYDALLTAFSGTELNSSSRNLKMLERFLALQTIYTQRNSAQEPRFQIRAFHDLLRELYLCLSSSSSQNQQPEVLQKFIRRQFSENPRKGLEALIKFKDKDVLQHILPTIINDHIASLLVKEAPKGILEFVKNLRAVLKTVPENSELNQLTLDFQKELDHQILEALIFQAIETPMDLFTYLLRSQTYAVNQTLPQQVKRLLSHLLKENSQSFKGISTRELDAISEKLLSFHQAPLLEQIEVLMGISHQQEIVGSMLAQHFTDSEFSQVRSTKNAKQLQLLNYLMPDGSTYMTKTIENYLDFLKSNAPHVLTGEVRTQLVELYWRCILKYEIHRGQAIRLNELFQATASAHYSIQNESLSTNQQIYLSGLETHLSEQELFEFVHQAIKTNQASIEAHNTSVTLSELLRKGIEVNKQKTLQILTKEISAQQRKNISKLLSFETFGVLLTEEMHGTQRDTVQIMRLLMNIAKSSGVAHVTDKLAELCWSTFWILLEGKSWGEQQLHQLMESAMTILSKETQVDTALFTSEMKRIHLNIGKPTEKVLSTFIPGLTRQLHLFAKKDSNDVFAKYHENGQLDALFRALISSESLPEWFTTPSGTTTTELFHKILMDYPVQFIRAFRAQNTTQRQQEKLFNTIRFEDLIRSIGYLHTNLQPLLGILRQLYVQLGTVEFKGIQARDVQRILFLKVLKAWSSNNWKIISTEAIWNELIWEVTTTQKVEKAAFIESITEAPIQLPPSLHISFSYLHDQAKASRQSEKTSEIINAAKKVASKDPAYMTINKKEPIPVNNAGIVLLNNYYTTLMERLNLLTDGQFSSPENQQAAIHYMQYVATGQTTTEESYLVLNKVLCGLDISEPVPSGIELSEENKTLIDGLIQAAIGHWTSIGETSIDGFRGNWLVRDGMLTEQEDRWELVVEKRPYDILINQSPFSFSIIRYSWMEKALHVTWPY